MDSHSTTTETINPAPVTQEQLEILRPKIDVSLGHPNILEIPDLNIALEATSNKIIVLLDRYHSGYECPKCKGNGKLQRIVRCACDPINPDPDSPIKPGTRNRHGATCEICMGDYLSKRIDQIIDCPICKGKGHTIIIPDTAKSLPTTGVILSIGPDVTKVKLHTRVICSPFSGTFLPMKGNATIKIYTENEPLAYLHNLANEQIVWNMVDCAANKIIDLDTSKFVEIDVPLQEGNNA